MFYRKRILLAWCCLALPYVSCTRTDVSTPQNLEANPKAFSHVVTIEEAAAPLMYTPGINHGMLLSLKPEPLKVAMVFFNMR